MGLGGALLRYTNDLIGSFGFKLMRQRDIDMRRKVFPRGDFFDALESNIKSIKPMTIFDVGAYNGVSAKRFSEMYPHARIHSFEPSPDTYDELCQLTQQPEYSQQIVPHRLALSSQSGCRILHRHQAPQTDSLLDTHSEALDQWPDGRFSDISPVETRVETVDGICNQEAIEYVDILKIDAQGEDLRILFGAESMFTQERIGVVVVELYFVPVYTDQGEPHEIIRYLINHGFTDIAYLCHDVDKSGKILCVDAVFEHKKMR